MARLKEYKHALRVYEALQKESQPDVIEGNRVTVYRGKVTHLYSALNISQAYYSAIFRKLRVLGCITQLQRGDAGTATGYALHYPPDLDEYQALDNKPLTRPADIAMLRQGFEGLREEIGGVNIGELAQRVTELEERLRRVERKVNSGKSKNTNERKEA